jgi:hypothetical protein
MEPPRNAVLERLALLLEREARLAGVDIEPETTKIIEKLRRGREDIGTGHRPEQGV